MSSILSLAGKLRELSPSELQQVLANMVGNSAGCKDLFDLSRLLLTGRELESRIRKLPAKDLDLLAAGKSSKNLQASYLADSKPFPETTEALERIEPGKRPKLGVAGGNLTAYETMLCLTEIHYALEQHWFDVMKTGLRAQDAKLVAEKLKWQSKDVQLRFRLGMRAGHFAEHLGRWVTTEVGQKWLTKTREQALSQLIESIWDLPPVKISEGPIIDQLLGAFPLMVTSNLAVLDFGPTLGLLDGQVALKPMTLGSKGAAKEIAENLPVAEDRLIVQGDLSIVCPSPLTAKLHKQLDSFADSEDLGLASRFRLSALSLSHHLETGGSLKDVRKTLADLSGKSLPQPVEYLLSEVEAKFGRLTIARSAETTIVSSTDEILLTQIKNERALNHLSLAGSSGALRSPSSVELCYFSLRDAGYAAVMLDENKRIVSPRFTASLAHEVQSDDELAARAKGLLSSEKTAADPSDVLRQLEFALKNKLKVQLKIELPNGIEEEFLLTPLGLGAGRLRGRDEERQAERTLPVSRIKSVVLS